MRLPLVALVLLLPIVAAPAAADAGASLRVYPSESRGDAEGFEGCGSPVRVYAARAAPVTRAGRAIASWSSGLDVCPTVFRFTALAPARLEPHVDVRVGVSCDVPQTLSPDSFEFVVVVAGTASVVARPTGAGFVCGRDGPVILGARLQTPTPSWRAGDVVDLRIVHARAGPLPEPMSVYFEATPQGPPLLTIGMVKPTPIADRASSTEQVPSEPENGRAASWIIAGVSALFVLRRPRAVLLGLFARIARDRLQEHPVRASLLDVVGRRPGIALAELHGLLEVSRGTVRYHIGVLRAAGLLICSPLGGRVHVFVRGPSSADQVTQALKRRPWAQRILAAIEAAPGCSQRTVAKGLGVHASTVAREVRTLVEAGLVLRERRGIRQRLFIRRVA